MNREGQSCYEEGVRLEKAGDISGAFEAFRHSAKADPAVAAPYIGLARILSRNHQRAEAIACLKRAAACERRNPVPHILMGETLTDDGQLDNALGAYRAALELDPASARALLGIASIHEDKGDRQEAAKIYRQLLQAHPDNADGLAGLLALAEGEVLDGAISDAKATMETTSDRDTALVGYALGKALSRSRRHEESFAALATANAARRHDAGAFDRETFDRRIDQLIEIFSPAFFAKRSGWGISEQRPVFIVGLPRSGTTLTEQILSGHSDIHGAGELDFLTDLATGLPDRLGRADPPWPKAVLDLSRGGVEALARDFLARIDRLAPSDASRIVDKQPLNFWHLGLVALAFPKARIVNCRRDIRDCGLSIFAENFTPEQRWATSLEDIVHYWHGYRRLMAHWRSATDLQVLDLHYEDLVRDLERESRRLLDFVGVEWHPSVLEFHNAERAVRTPSRWQVRKPLYTSSSGRWRDYERHIGPLIAAAETAHG